MIEQTNDRSRNLGKMCISRLWYNIIFISQLLIYASTFATNLGSFDPSFSHDGSSDGWDIQSSNSNNIMGAGIKVDSQGRVIAASILDTSVRVLRYLADGSLDVNFDTDGLLELPKPINGVIDVGISMGSSDDFFVSYSFEFCAGNACDLDVVVYHVDTTGLILSST
ncbi:MAG TPA: hypothetical protein ENJ41_01100, partial [Oceanospirillales bacterium]|nr:hypothetical protein [Oceanospirillales bacterium]